MTCSVIGWRLCVRECERECVMGMAKVVAAGIVGVFIATHASAQVWAAARYAAAAPFERINAYRVVNLVANRPEFHPQIVDPLLADGWGIAIRPPGAGGHFWIMNAASGTTTTYVGDVPGVPLYQDALRVVNVPTSRLYQHLPDTVSRPTGIVYTGDAQDEFVVTSEGIIGGAKFLFAALDGTISGWTTNQTRAVNLIDRSGEGAMYTGLAATQLAHGNRIFAADFGLEQVEVYDAQFREVYVPGTWRDSAVPLTYSVWNMQILDGRLFVTWARQGDDPGEEDHHPGYGYISEFDFDGNVIASFEHRLELNAPWGLAIAPANFGAMSGKLLVGNFADGKILAYDLGTRRFIDFLRDGAGEPIVVDGLWGMLFGNGVRLGYTNHLYFAAGPNNEEDGVFGKIVPVQN